MTTVMQKAEPRRERKKAAVRAHILSTAIQLFSQHGLDSVTVDQIADAADIGKGTIYNYFSTKEDIVVAFMVDFETRVQAKVRRLVISKGSLQSILAEFIRFQFRMKKPYHQFVRVFLGQMFLRTEQFIPYMFEMQKAIDPPLEALFRGLQERGLMRKDVHPPELVVIFKTIHLGLTALWAVEGPPFQFTEKTLKQEIKLFCQGLRTTT
ncbi:MAG TPA: TetR/AcrR family transcriptional regulator [Candidatus Acidoferrales bacterium]|nr:TetR/AcrR family transcriptional regulator [Candidatus Acidoferrales bacterium]